MSGSWYLVSTKPLCEYKAAAALERNGYDIFFPRVQTPRPRLGHDDSPIFPGYLFIRRDQGLADLPPIERVAGLRGWVQFDGVVPPVPDEVIDELARRIRTINSHGGHWDRFQPGQTVRVTSGWIDNLAKVVEEPESPKARVRVLLNFMGRLVRARVPWEDLQPVGEAQVRAFRSRSARRTRGKGRWIRGYGPRAIANA